MTWCGATTGEWGRGMASTHGSAVHGAEDHLNGNDDKDRDHGDETGHGGVGLVPEFGETWVGEGCECCGEKVDECGCYQNAGTEAIEVLGVAARELEESE